MPFIFYLKIFMPLLATIPPALAAIWIGSRWLRLRHGGADVQAEIAALRNEVDTLGRELAETQERLDFAEGLLKGLREAHSELPRSS